MNSIFQSVGTSLVCVCGVRVIGDWIDGWVQSLKVGLGSNLKVNTTPNMNTSDQRCFRCDYHSNTSVIIDFLDYIVNELLSRNWNQPALLKHT